ncbi:hypothetical protein ASPZODRAFT_139850 [Penicilliopsis zonata CBS 506.65]|uniref:Protein PBN1 n=1 Tax=Penicilliopsis zonata CBS 506.65 TaxID=1073090 RepID=A0A1L9SP42_9EURO|nr:hypothetical protein ASPZODRAFT_139850 [Penicilliopsis zonata CBS 506.65]OJJ48896.1 hypothetical protein ASPZODRAFT_139850 [Penicilliopsis zonata CBS 506.65]
MKTRYTFILRPGAPFTLDQTTLTSSSLSVRNLDAAREERVTFPSDEDLEKFHDLHIRWTTERAHDTLTPFASRVSAGLHVLFTPVEGAETCPLLNDAFGVECSEESSIQPPILSSQRFSQFYSLLPSLDHFVDYIQRKICGESSGDECRTRSHSLLSADSVDVDYDSILHTLTITGHWSPPEGGWTETLGGEGRNVEIGLLGVESSNEPEEVKVGGFLAVLGQDDKLSMISTLGKRERWLKARWIEPTLFSFPSRHHALETSYSVSFTAPTGLHPTMTISLPRRSLQRPALAAPEATCALHTYLTLPSTVFADKYQLSSADPLFLRSHRLRALHAVSGETDLEAPDWSVPSWGSTWLLEIDSSSPEEEEEEEEEEEDRNDTGSSIESADEMMNMTIPLHLRYLPPSESGYRPASMPWPVVFWACTSQEETPMGVNPFDRVDLGWDGLFAPRTTFYHLAPGGSSGQSLVSEIPVPVLQLDATGLTSVSIELGTVLVILLGVAWVVSRLAFSVKRKTQ